MSFVSWGFLFFFAAAAFLFWLAPCSLRAWVLLAADVLYMASFGLASLAALCGVTLLTWLCALQVERAAAPGRRRAWLVLGLAGSAGWLFARKLLAAAPAFSPVPAVGLAFYALQAAGYLADVYGGRIPAQKNLLRYALYTTFFPRLLSGPIGRYDAFAPQLDALLDGGARPQAQQLQAGFVTMLCGYAEKLILADTLRVFVDGAYGSYAQQPGCVLALATVLYAFSLYYDFAGYSHIAVGAAAVLGIRLERNFARPYLAVSLRDFWRRWHISLSGWLQRYIYIPLGGSRQGRARRWRNLVLTFLVSGLWHGTGLQFLFWGLLHGVYQIAADLLPATAPKRRWLRRLGVFVLVDLAWLFFRAPGLAAAFAILGRILTAFAPAALFDGTLLTLGLARTEWAAVLAAWAAAGAWALFAEREEGAGRDPARALRALPGAVRFAGLAGLAVLVLLFACRAVGGNAAAFYYAQF